MKTGYLTKKIESIVYPKPVLRDYIGASSIGKDCWREIWYELNGVKREVPNNKIQRTWDIGKALEIFVIDLLKLAGIQFEDYQIELFDSELAWFRGHFDALMENPSAILEIKTAKDSSFRQLVKHGVRKWSASYYAQVQAYMGMSGIHDAYVIVFNKDTSEFYDELIEFNPDIYDQLKVKARLIYDAPEPPERINNNPMWFQCKMCSYKTICHNKKDEIKCQK